MTKKATKTAPKKAAPKKAAKSNDINSRVKRVESICSRQNGLIASHTVAIGSINDAMIAMEARIMDHLDDLREMLIKLESSVAVLRSGASFMQELEPWKPQVGDWVVVKESHPAQSQHGSIKRVYSLSEDMEKVHYSGGASYVKNIRPATPEEVAAHLAAEEKKKVPKFGDRVMYKGKHCVVVSLGADAENEWTLLHTNDHGSTGAYWAKRREFTIID